MSFENPRITTLARFVRRHLVVLSAALLLTTSSAQAGTVLGFAQSNSSDTITGTVSGGIVTSLSTAGNADGGNVSIPVTVGSYLGAPFLGVMFETFVGVTSTDGTHFSGTIEFTSGTGGTGTNELTATFTDATFSINGGAAALTVSGNDVTFTSANATFGSNNAVALSFSDVSVGTTTFSAQNSGTLSTTAIPEPSTIVLGTFPLVLGALVLRKRKTK
jgi:hypothetical protein